VIAICRRLRSDGVDAHVVTAVDTREAVRLPHTLLGHVSPVRRGERSERASGVVERSDDLGRAESFGVMRAQRISNEIDDRDGVVDRRRVNVADPALGRRSDDLSRARD